jgi:hypothetical protein
MPTKYRVGEGFRIRPELRRKVADVIRGLLELPGISPVSSDALEGAHLALGV